MSNRKQRVKLNGQNSFWTNVHAEILQGHILGPPLYLIHINDLADGLLSNVKLFAHGTSLFLVVHDVHAPARELKDDLKKINKYAFQ